MELIMLLDWKAFAVIGIDTGKRFVLRRKRPYWEAAETSEFLISNGI